MKYIGQFDKTTFPCFILTSGAVIVMIPSFILSTDFSTVLTPQRVHTQEEIALIWCKKRPSYLIA